LSPEENSEQGPDLAPTISTCLIVVNRALTAAASLAQAARKAAPRRADGVFALLAWRSAGVSKSV
jgi:hypothetical protein